MDLHEPKVTLQQETAGSDNVKDEGEMSEGSDLPELLPLPGFGEEVQEPDEESDGDLEDPQLQEVLLQTLCSEDRSLEQMASGSAQGAPEGGAGEEGEQGDFLYPSGVRNPHLARFDTRDEACQPFGFSHGDIVISEDGLLATTIGVSRGELWFHGEQTEGAGRWPDGRKLSLLGRVKVQEGGSVEAPSKSDDWLQLDFPYPAGPRAATIEKFDIREDICINVGGFRHGEVVQLPGVICVAIGVRRDERDECGRLHLWFHPDGYAGAGILTREQLTTATVVMTITVQPATTVAPSIQETGSEAEESMDSPADEPAEPVSGGDQGGEVRWAALHEQANAHLDRGEFRRAESLFVECRDLLAQVLGKHHPNYATVLSDLGVLYLNTGEFAQAEPLFLECRDVRAQALGEGHPEYAAALSNLGSLYKAMGNFAKAEALHIECLDIEAAVLGRQHPDYATTLHNLAKLYEATGDLPRAEPLLLECRDIQAKVLGTQDSDYAITLDSLASVYYEMGEYARAEPLFLECKDIQVKSLGRKHPDYGTTLNNLGNLYRAKGNWAKAKPLLLECKDILAQTVGRLHPSYAATLDSLAFVHFEMGEFPRAEPLYLECQDIRAKVLGRQHPDYATSVNNLASLYEETGDLARAEALMLECRDIEAQSLGRQHPRYAISLNNLARLYEATGDLAKAEELLLESKDIQLQALGRDHPNYAITVNNLTTLYQATEDFDKASPLLLECKDVLEKALGRQHPSYALTLNNLAGLYKATGDLARAELFYLQSKEIRAKALGTQHPDYAATLNNLGGLYRAMGDLATAESLYLDCRSVWEQALGRQHPNCATVLENLARLYLDTQRPAETLDALTTAGRTQFRLMTLLLPTLSERRMLECVKELDNTVQFLVTVLAGLGGDGDAVAIERGYDVMSCCKNLVFDAQVLTIREENEELAEARWRLSRLVTSNNADEVGASLKELWDEVERMEEATGRSGTSRLSNYSAESFSMTRDISTKLPAHAALAEFTVSAHESGARYVVFVLARNPTFKVSLLDIGLVEEIDLMIEEFCDGILAPWKGADMAAVPLRQAILDPVKKAIGSDTLHLFIVPDGQIATLPFAALPDAVSPSEKTKYVLEGDLSISYLSSAKDLLRVELPDQAPPGKSVVIANPDYSSTSHEGHAVKSFRGSSGALSSQDDQRGTKLFDPLPGTSREGELVARLLPDAEEPLTGTSATVRAFLNVSRPRVLHVATHGFFLSCGASSFQRLTETIGKQENPLLRSGLTFAGAKAWQKGQELDRGSDNGIATALDMLSMDLHGTELATISACESGLGDCRVGQGVFGLGRSLQLAGARHVALSLWSIPDSETTELMKLFYSAVQEASEGVHTYAEAMRTAQRALCAKPGVGPRLWGAFVIYGY